MLIGSTAGRWVCFPLAVGGLPKSAVGLVPLAVPLAATLLNLSMPGFRLTCDVCGFGYSTWNEAGACEDRHAKASRDSGAGEKLSEGLIVNHEGRFFELREDTSVRLLSQSKEERPMEMGAVTFGQLRAANLRDFVGGENHIRTIPVEAWALTLVGVVGDLSITVANNPRPESVHRQPVGVGDRIANVVVQLDLLAVSRGLDLGECVRQHFLKQKKAAAA